MRALGFVAMLAACSPSNTAPADGETASARGCQAVATQPWRPLSGAEFTVVARASGPDCEHAVALLAIRDTQNNVLWTGAFATAQVMTLAHARDVETMQTELSEWINSSNRTMAVTSALPDWRVNAQGPENGEFPFYPEPEWDRDAYLALRARNLPMFCFVQGMESMACLALENGALNKVGVQSFPG